MSKSQFFAVVSIPAILLASSPAFTQVTLDHLLATVSVNAAGKCSAIDVRLNRPVSYLHHFPATKGNSLAITVEPLGTTAGADADTSAPEKEAASVAPGNKAGLDGVSYDPSATGGPEIRLTFDHTVAFRVVTDTNTRHLRIDVSAPGDALACFGHAETMPATNTDQSGKSDGPVATGTAEAALAEGKKQLAAKDYARATAFFTKAVTIGSGATKQDAQELLGLSHERAGQLPHAQAEYQVYLKAYPKGAGAARVKSRLEGVRAAMDQQAESQFAAKRAKLKEDSVLPEITDGQVKPVRVPKPSEVAAALADQSGKGDAEVAVGGLRSSGKGMVLAAREPVKDPKAWTWEHSGSLSQYYYRNDNYRSSDPASHNFGLHEVYQNEAISSGDAYLRGENQDYEIELRGAAYNEKGFGQQKSIRSTNIGTLYADLRAKNTGVSARLGRQSKSTGGVFGRFDGALLGWQINKETKVQAYAGSPVYRRDAKPFADKRVFYGASIDYSFPGDHWAGALYAMAQDIGNYTDRRALGAELRYSGKTLTAYSAGDYDFYFKELNNAYVSANWHVRDGTNVYASADFRRVPFLLTENALMGQGVDDLETLVSIWGEDNVYQFAQDRTASAKTVNGGVSQDLNKDWQASIDATVASYSGTPASGGVDAIPAPGTEYYMSATLNGTNLLRDSDSLTFGLRYSGSKSSNFYMADLYYRYPVTENWRINPRIRFSMRDSKTTDQKQYLIVPSVSSRYRMSKKWSFESELSLRWEDLVTSMGDAKSLNLQATAGYRFEF